MKNDLFNCNDCCNQDDDCDLLNSCLFSKCNCNNRSQTASVDDLLDDLSDELCDARINAANANTSLIILAQSLRNNGGLSDLEKLLLVNIEKQLRCLTKNICNAKNNADCLDKILS